MKKLLLFIALIIISCSKGDESESKSSSISYETVKYGSLIWSIENANIEAYRDGTPIPKVSDVTEWRNLTTGAWCYIDNDSSKRKLYNWYAIVGIHDNDVSTPNKIFAPNGWRVSTLADWQNLEDFLNDNDYLTDYEQTSSTQNTLAACLSAKTSWRGFCSSGCEPPYYSHNYPGKRLDLNNSSGFTAFADGCRLSGNSTLDFHAQETNAFFWTKSEFTDDLAVSMVISYNGRGLVQNPYDKKRGVSVRLIKN